MECISVKKISILVPCYNEAENIGLMANTLMEIMQQYQNRYDYEIIFRDNASTDESVNVLRSLARSNPRIKVIVNARNYGFLPEKNTFFGRTSGDVMITIASDFQVPPELIPEFITWWEKGYEVVCGQKITSQENRLMFRVRQLFYDIIDKFSDVPQYRNMTGITLLSRRLYNMLANGNDKPLRYFISDLGCEIKLVPYEQQKRRAGKSSYNVWRYTSLAITSLISVSTKPLRIATILGFLMSVFSFLVGLVYLILKLIFWQRFSAGTAPILIGMFFLGSVQLFFIGLLGEYVGNILHKVTHKNPPIVRELINLNEDDPYYIKAVDTIHENNEE